MSTSKDQTLQYFNSGTGAVPYWSEGWYNQAWSDGWHSETWYSPIQVAPKALLTKQPSNPTESKPKDVVELKVYYCSQDGFQRKLRKALYRVDGVWEWNYEQHQGKVTVRGSAKPERILKAVQSVHPRAEIWKDPKKTKN